VCYCAHVVAVPTNTRVLVLQHPREAERAIGTARIARLCLPNASIAVGVGLADDPAVRAALADEARQAVVLYPGKTARDLATDPPRAPVTLIVLDGTWAHARALVRENPWLSSLPHYRFTPERESEYRIRREPAPHCVSTIEALIEALALLEGDRHKVEPLRAPFRAMVAMQVAHAEASRDPRRRERRRVAGATPRLPPELAGEFVCLLGEANAWPHDRALGRPPYPHELVHLLLWRSRDDAHLETFARPESPLASSPFAHARLRPEQLAQAESAAHLHAAAENFLAAEQVVCTWGYYARDLYLQSGGRLPPRVVDLRKVVGDALRKRPGTLEQTVQELKLPHHALGAGRGGERMGMLVAVARHFAHAARRPAVLAPTHA
jgi:DTW domain-containing protein